MESQKIKQIETLIEKHKQIVENSEKGKIEINFNGTRVTISITIFDESKEEK
jgi:hypothetical protein